MLIGFVGKPSTGKSTFFKACTLADVAIANYPFTTISKNEGITFVKIDCIDKEFNKQCNPRTGYCIDHKRFIPVDLLDVAGLVPGASEGKGLGNQFLDDLRKADVLIHVVDISGSTNEKGEPVTALSYDPLNDIEFLENEIETWYTALVTKGWDKFTRQQKMEHGELFKAVAKQLSGLGVTEDIAENILRKFNEDLSKWTQEDIIKLARTLRQKTKPIIIAANKIDVPGAEKNMERIKKKYPDYVIIPCSAMAELTLRELTKDEKISYIPGENSFKILKDLDEKQNKILEYINLNILKKFNSTGVQQVLNSSVFDILKYIAIYPGGVNKLTDSEGRILPDCFLLKEGSTALDFAFKLHTDFGKNFIRAIDVKKKLTVGKDYLLKHKDVIEIVANK